VASRQGSFKDARKCADFAIYKDIDINNQLAKALEKTMGRSRAKSK
jgi:hypothetical protein